MKDQDRKPRLIETLNLVLDWIENDPDLEDRAPLILKEVSISLERAELELEKGAQ